MAGRPCKKSRRVRELTDRAHALVIDLHSQMPTLYQERTSSSDPVSRAWREALVAAVNSRRAIFELSELLAAKAGIVAMYAEPARREPAPQ
jgi:hypothetical protein